MTAPTLTDADRGCMNHNHLWILVLLAAAVCVTLFLTGDGE